MCISFIISQSASSNPWINQRLNGSTAGLATLNCKQNDDDDDDYDDDYDDYDDYDGDDDGIIDQ